ncbi:MAG TPA: penicillin-binding transpeptidase domain-containing protein, partial [Gammaproteobacteria bacterium]|nr:penicillin-binding transpeptidase domain-containing protein [Gammaproteobacteria bacterium]
RPGLVPDPQWKRRARGEGWYTGETLIHGIGQGYLNATPVQLASAAAMIANRGEPVRPHLFLRARGPGEPRHEPAEPVVPPLELSVPSDWEFVVDAMVGVTQGERGTARAIGWKSPHTIAGKTGTAQVFGLGQGEEYEEEEIAERLRDHALFIAFAPAGDPRIAVGVIVENGGSGGAVAGPIARAVIKAYLRDGDRQAAAPEEEQSHG